ncbi:MAG: D-isomer specific 2-hydroxyacid dehydrogenase family protein [Eubacteriales bacterium]|nr:D-isomer specific 2-hydroxyacid dehydrogenase family protein [Eubacteriales bacterium]
MEIAAFEVRKDEEALFSQASSQFGCTIRCFEEILTPQNARKAEGCSAVTTLGRSVFDRKLLECLHHMGIRCVATRTVGYDHIRLPEAKRLGIQVCNSGYGPEGVADYTVMMILLCLRNYKQALWRAQVNDYSLYGLQGRELKDLTVGIVGPGHIGRAVIKNLSGFGCRILTCSSHRDPEIQRFAKYRDLDGLYRESDVISFHLPLNDDTHHMVNRESLAKMKDGVVLINTARGELMDIRALEWGIESQKIGALAMDVIEGERGIYHEDKRCDIIKNKDMAYLRQFPNVVMTQHLAFYTDAAVQSMVMQSIEGLVQMASGLPCRTRLV